jgi:hypothetical protein
MTKIKQLPPRIFAAIVKKQTDIIESIHKALSDSRQLSDVDLPVLDELTELSSLGIVEIGEKDQAVVDPEQLLGSELSGIQYAIKEAKRGNTDPLIWVAWNFCSLSGEEKSDIQHELEHERRRLSTVHRVENILIAYRHGSLIAAGVTKKVDVRVAHELDCARTHVHVVVAANKHRGGVFSLV